MPALTFTPLHYEVLVGTLFGARAVRCVSTALCCIMPLFLFLRIVPVLFLVSPPPVFQSVRAPVEPGRYDGELLIVLPRPPTATDGRAGVGRKGLAANLLHLVLP